MYPSTADLVAASTVTALTGLTEPQQDALRDAAIAAVETYCRQRFITEGTDEEPVTKRMDGTGTEVLYLPARLVSLDSVRVSGSEIGVSTSDVVVGDDRDRLSLPGDLGGGTWADRALAEAEGHTRPVFPAGSDNIQVAGVWGWTDDEYTDQLAAITTGLRYFMEDQALAGAHALGDTVKASRALGLGSVNQGRLSVDLGPEVALTARVRAQIGRFRFEHSAGAAI